jgi:3-hydroxyacyl-CoA dehydrogenase / enoyl-CoA hydratase / 3-hydroxybutyryl-CoA epimerase
MRFPKEENEMSDGESMIRWERAGDIVVLLFDAPGQSANTMNAAYDAAMAATLDRLESERDEIAGVVLTSAKRSFFAGGDLNELIAVQMSDATAYEECISARKAALRRLETLGLPVVAAIAGSALGGGLEIALAAHRRVVINDPRIQLGLPEVTLGLMPGAGGVVRTVRMFGIVAALERLLLEGEGLRPEAASELGLVDEVVATGADLLPAAKRWIEADPEPRQPWDREGWELPGGSPHDPAFFPVLQALPARLSAQSRGANYPAPQAILAATTEGAQVDFATATEIEGSYFLSLVLDQTAKNMIQAFFFDLQKVRGTRGRDTDAEPFRPRKAVVLGAGVMGAGIAHSCAAAGIEVVLKDLDLGAAEAGVARCEQVVSKAVTRGRLDAEEGAALLARIRPSADPADAAGAEMVIEAVFEDPVLKASVLAEIEAHVAPDALLASNTSTLPIDGLAAAVSRPGSFVGLHFFSPVDRMPLLEIVRGARTDDEALGRALDIAGVLGKTPIVVNDSRGFYTSRVFATFLDEGMAMLGEGIPAASIEQASMQAGYPAPVLQLSDDINLALTRRVHEQNRAAAGDDFVPHPAEAIVVRMIDELDRGGRVAGAGFYDYEDGRRGRLWSGLGEAFGPVATPPPFQELVERMLFAESLEAARAYGEEVIESVADANIGSILGIGFPRWTGGTLQYVNGYPGGPGGFVARARELAERYGSRFDPPRSLVDMAERGETFADGVAAPVPA